MNTPMTRDEENDFYREMSPTDKLNIVGWFFQFKRRLEKKENPKVTVHIETDLEVSN